MFIRFFTYNYLESHNYLSPKKTDNKIIKSLTILRHKNQNSRMKKIIAPLPDI